MLEKNPQKLLKNKDKKIMNFGDQTITPLWDSKQLKKRLNLIKNPEILFEKKCRLLKKNLETFSTFCQKRLQ